MDTKGLLIVFTGDGKGKTTAALGMAMRSAGHDLPVCIIQFIKGGWVYGEIEAVKHFPDLIDLHVMGRGFTWKSDNLEEDRRLALEAWGFAREIIDSGRYHMVILDEFTYLLHYKMLELDLCLDVLDKRKPEQHVVITGRHAPEPLLAKADLVTEMQVIKHPLRAGVKAQPGIEF
ncbi:MAG: cob(I)yrinic acid a,c-diamide adenosyltransferase [Desulfobulbus sp.]|jgi:cob(I)alamin adenosyltransferase|nr:cob(I)yrinic acid a,c-diamide adenosyltransferase [Desulfobulbaceae bacterium]